MTSSGIDKYDVTLYYRAADARKARCTNITLGLVFCGLFIFLVAVSNACMGNADQLADSFF